MVVYGYTILDLLCAALLFRTLDICGTEIALARWMRSGLLVRFGKYSYGLYVWHFAISAFVRPVTQAVRHHLPGVPNWILAPAAFIAGVSISYGIALLSWKLIERPFMVWKERIAGATAPPAGHSLKIPDGN